MALNIELHENETVEMEFAGDYWEGSVFSSQIRGNYQLTSERILFQGGFFATTLDLPYTEIASVATCNVGPLLKFVPTGIKVTMRDGTVYRLSVLKRKETLAFIQSRL